ncbi:hypothetical protein C8F04DRAFT_946756 [Mycena alexandri]|uniref:Uncharacterized protein n=1 Tax=Mycena alexandri TaxID=1745969 RepID=A0AAD6XBE6_9AGAR|nr:hypothetical protein C8F04DRAFT_946756 [Mycena alexandri]
MAASSYSFRAGFATRLLKAAGCEVAAGAMAHVAGSHVISESYDDGNRQLDFFVIATGETDQGNMQARRGVAMHRAPVDVLPLDLAGLVVRVPMITILIKQAGNLESCIAMGRGKG